MVAPLASALNNTRISLKLFIAPGVITIFMLGLAWVGMAGAGRQSAALDQVVNVAHAKNGTLVTISEAVDATHISLYRMLSWLANSTDTAKAKASAEEVDKHLAEARGAVARLSTKFALSADERKAAAGVGTALKNYAEATKNVVDLAVADVATGLTFMSDTEDKFTALEQALGVLAGVEKSLTDRTVAAAEAGAADTARLSIGVLAVA
ncbi:MAG: MCP four helix bundle domain-containing protein, partial [Candidatus Eiseniibacteriota bacterium]